MENRTLKSTFTARSDEGGNPVIKGYFACFGDVYEVCPGATESIREGAFTDSISGDVRALFNHNSDIVLGRTGAGTLTLKQDSHGLWGEIKIDPEDTDAMNAYRRIQRGSITGCSFSFEIEAEETEIRDNGDIHWTITKVNPLYEVSPVTFPAYKGTSVAARSQEREGILKRRQEAWRAKALRRLKNGTESNNAEEKD